MPKLTKEEAFSRSPIKIISTEYLGLRHKYTFECPLCKNHFKTTLYKVNSGHTKYCGCNKGAKRKGTKNISRTFWSRIVQHARHRNIDVEITIQDLEDLLIKQDFKCALSGLPIEVGYGSLKKKDEVTGSVDRIDNNKGYLKDNIQFVHKDINWMKQDFEQSKFLEYCFRIYQHKHES